MWEILNENSYNKKWIFIKKVNQSAQISIRENRTSDFEDEHTLRSQVNTVRPT